MKIVHLSDLHVVAAPRTLYASDPRANLARVLAHVIRHHGDAAFLWITGDLVHDGDQPAYRALKDLLAACPMRVHLGLGNHDARATFKRVFPEAPMGDPDYLQYAVDTPEGVFLMLDTLEPGLGAGRLDATRLAWLQARLDEHKDRDVFIGLHHPPYETGIAAMDRIRLTVGARELGEVLRAHGRVRHLFHGHVHRPITACWQGMPISTVPGTNHQVALALGKDPTVLGCFDPPGYAVALIRDGAVCLHQERVADPGAPLYNMEDKAAEAASCLDAMPLFKTIAAE